MRSRYDAQLVTKGSKTPQSADKVSQTRRVEGAFHERRLCCCARRAESEQETETVNTGTLRVYTSHSKERSQTQAGRLESARKASTLARKKSKPASLSLQIENASGCLGSHSPIHIGTNVRASESIGMCLKRSMPTNKIQRSDNPGSSGLKRSTDVLLMNVLCNSLQILDYLPEQKPSKRSHEFNIRGVNRKTGWARTCGSKPPGLH